MYQEGYKPLLINCEAVIWLCASSEADCEYPLDWQFTGWIMRDTMIGFYDYTVILTYISLASSILGMISACYARIGWAIFFLGMSGLLDTFDGKVARTKKNRTEDQKRFGIQID